MLPAAAMARTDLDLPLKLLKDAATGQARFVPRCANGVQHC